MRYIKPYIVGIMISVLALIPPINFAVKAPSEYWPYMVILAGFAGFYILFLRTNYAIKFIAVAGFINCFFSIAPYISFTAYISLLACCYFYVLCQRVQDYEPIFKVLQCLMLFVGFMLVMQTLQMDVLLNMGRAFSRGDNYCFGVIGQRMQSASFAVILSAALMPKSAYYSLFPLGVSFICNSAGGFLCASFGLIAYLHRKWKKRFLIILPGMLVIIFLCWLVVSGKYNANTNATGGRLAVWIASLKMAIQRPLMGWGMSTYKGVFPALGGITGIPWKTAHNCWVQMIFEFGFPIALTVMGYFGYLMIQLARLTRRALFRTQAFRLLGGLVMISLNMCFHFPTRMAQTVLIMIFFLAYVQKFIDLGGKNGIR